MYVVADRQIASIARGNGVVELRRRSRVWRWTQSTKRGRRFRGDWVGVVMVIDLVKY